MPMPPFAGDDSRASARPALWRDVDVAARLGAPVFNWLNAGGFGVVACAEPPQILWADRGALARFGAADARALSARLLDGAEPGARRLRELLAAPASAAPRLERLRFRTGVQMEAMTFAVRRLDRDGARLLLMAAPDARIAPADVAASLAALAPNAAVEPPSLLAIMEAPSPHAATTVEIAQPDVAASAAGPTKPAGPGPAAPKPTRFVWETDAQDRFVSVGPELAAALGGVGALAGRSLAQIVATHGVDPEGALAAAFARRATWSGVPTLWPVEGEPFSAPVDFFGAPVLDRARRFKGYRGFGVIRAERLPREVSPCSPAAPQAPAAPESIAPEPAAAPQGAVAQGADAIGGAPPVRAPESAPHGSTSAQPESVPRRGDAEDAAAAAAARDHESLLAKVAAALGALGVGGLVARKASDAAPSARPTPSPPDSGDAAAAFARDLSGALASTRAPHAPVERTDDHPVAPSNDQRPLAESAPGNVVPIRPAPRQTPAARGDSDAAAPVARETASVELTAAERQAFRDIARSLGARPEERAPRRDVLRLDSLPEDGAQDPPSHEFSAQELPDQELPAQKNSAQENSAQEFPAAAATLSPAAVPAASEPGLAAVATLDPAAAAPTAPASAPTSTALVSTALARNSGAMLDRLPVGVLVSRGDEVVYANRTLLDLLGFDDVHALQGAGGLGYMFHGREPEKLRDAADGGAVPIVAQDGQVLPVDIRIQKLDWEGEAASLFTVRRSLEGEAGAKVKTLELELRARQAEARELAAILDTATDGVVVLDDEGRILGLNRSAEALFGYDQNEVAGEGFSILFTPSAQRLAADYLDGLRANGVASLLNDGREVTGRERQGGVIPLFMTVGRITTTGPAKFCAVLRDMTHWKKAELQLQQARKDAERASALKSDFLAKISHEIRTPLNAILGFAEVIMEERFGPVGNDRYKDYLKDIHASGSHVMTLLNDLLDLSKIEAGKLELSFAAVDMNRVVNECVSQMQGQALTERVILRVSLGHRLPQVVADERSLRQIVFNLLSNAIKFNEPGGQVIVSTALTDAGSAVLRVRDTGLGMSEEEIEIALEPFRQIANAKRRGGTGLGLPLTKALAEANRASFVVKSRKGEGTLVEVVFPPTRVLAG